MNNITLTNKEKEVLKEFLIQFDIIGIEAIERLNKLEQTEFTKGQKCGIEWMTDRMEDWLIDLCGYKFRED